MTATEIEVGKRFSRVAFKMQTPKPKLDRAEGMERWGGIRGRPGLQFAWVLAPAFPYTTQHVSCSAVVLVCPQGGHCLSMQMEAQFKLCLSFAIPGDNQTKRIYLSLAKSNPSQEKPKHQVLCPCVSWNRACIVWFASRARQRHRELRTKRRNPLNNSGNNFITLVAGICMNTTKRTRS